MSADESTAEVAEGVLQSLTWQRGLIALAVLAGFIVAAKAGSALLHRALSRHGKMSGAAFALIRLFAYALVVCGVLVALGLLGVPLGSLLLPSGLALVGLGFGLQQVAGDFVSGIALLVEQTIRRGDFVTFGDTRGTVIEIGLRSTQLLTRDGTALIVPNHMLTSTEVSNHSAPSKRARLLVELPIGFGEDVELVRETLLGVARDNEKVLAEPAPFVRFDAILETSFQFALIAWVRDPVATLRVASELRFAVVAALAERGIELPVPELELREDRRRRAARARDGSSEPAPH